MCTLTFFYKLGQTQKLCFLTKEPFTTWKPFVSLRPYVEEIAADFARSAFFGGLHLHFY